MNSFRPFFALLGLLMLIFLSACANPKQDLITQIADIEDKTQKSPDDAQMRSLMTLYVQFIQRYPTDQYAPVYIYKIAEVYYRLQKWDEALRHVNMIIEKHPDSPYWEDALLFAGLLYDERIFDQTGGDKVYKLYLAKYPNGKGRQAAEMHFKSPQERLIFRIENMEKQLAASPNDANLPVSLAYAYKNYAQSNPQDVQTPRFCMQGAKLAAGAGESFLAIELWDIIAKNYQNFPERPYVMFLAAMEHEEKAFLQAQRYRREGQPFEGAAATYQNTEKEAFIKIAGERYKSYLSEYPQHELAKDAKTAIQNLGKDANEIVNSFIKKQKESN